MFELSGRIVVQDAFSKPLESLRRQTAGAKTSVETLGSTLDTRLGAGATAGTAAAGRSVTDLKGKVAGLHKQVSTPVVSGISAGPFNQQRQAVEQNVTGFAALKQAGQGLMGSMTGLYRAIAGSAVVLGALRIAASAVDLVRIGAQAQDITTVFNSLSRQAGLTGSTLLASMTTASRGTTDQIELMRVANRAMLAGGREFAIRLPEIFAGALAMARATGQDVGFVIDTLTKGITKASPLLIDNAEIYLKIGSALDEYATKQGKTVEQMSRAEESAALADIILMKLRDTVEELGLTSATSADMIASLPAAMKDLKIAIGEAVAQMEIGGFVLPMWFAGLAEVFRQMTIGSQGTAELQERIDELDMLGRAGDARNFAQALAQIKAGRIEVLPGEAPSTALARTYGFVLEQADLAVQRAKGVSEAELAQAAAAREAAAAERELADAMQPYTRALGELRTKEISPAATMAQLGQITGAMEKLRSAAAVPPPGLGEMLIVDTAALRDWVSAIDTADPALAAARDQTLQAITVTEEWQWATLRSILAVDNHAVALVQLAHAVMGPAAGLRELVARFADLPPEVQYAAEALGLFDAALAEIQSRAARGITVDVRLQGYESALSEIDSIALRMVGAFTPEQIRQFRDQMRTDFTQHWQELGDVDQFGMDLQKAILLSGYQDMAKAATEYYGTAEKAAAKHSAAMYESASALQGAIESALRVGLEVTPEQMALAEIGKYVPVALESARQLQAVAERGFAELKVHPDWAGLLKIPPDVLQGSEAELKAWAAAAKSAVTDLARPDLINWDAFVAAFEAQLEREAAKKLTIDIAVGKLTAAGVLTGSEEERKRKVAEFLGLEVPKMTIEALFETAPDAQGKLLTSLLQGEAAMKVPAEVVLAGPVAMLPAAVAPQTVEAPAAVGALAAPPVALIPQQTVDLTQAGVAAAGSLLAGFSVTVTGQNISAIIFAAWSVNVVANKNLFATMGTTVGSFMADAFVEAVKEGIGNVRQDMARIIAPEVEAILARKRAGTGAVP